MIFVPLLHYFKCKNSYSGNEYGLLLGKQPLYRMS